MSHPCQIVNARWPRHPARVTPRWLSGPVPIRRRDCSGVVATLPPRLPGPEQLATLSDTELSELTALLVEELQRRATLDITAASSRLS